MAVKMDSMITVPSRDRKRTLAPAVVYAETSCHAVETEEEFRALEGEWRRLAGHTPMAQWEWLLAWWEIFGPVCPQTGRKGRPYVVQVRRGDATVAIFPFVHHRAPWWDLRRLRPMGYSGELEPSGLSEEPIYVCSAEHETEAVEAVERHVLGQVAKGRWDCALIRRLAPSAAKGTTADWRAVLNRKVKRGPGYFALAETWAAFRKGLSKSMRDNLNYYPRLLTRAGHEFQVRFYAEDCRLSQAADRLIRLHKERVHGDRSNGHRDYFLAPWHRQMLVEGVQRMAAEGKGFIAALEVDGQEIAMQAFFEADGRIVVHYGGFDPAFSKFSPLLVLQAEVFKQAMARGVREVDLLYGSAPWQTRWGAEPHRQEVRALAIRPRPLTIARTAIYALRRELNATARRKGLKAFAQRATQQLSALAGAGVEAHLFAIRVASSPAAHHLARLHR